MHTQLRRDFRYFGYSGLWLLMTALFLLGALMICHTNDQHARMNIITYQRSAEIAERDGEDIQALIEQGYSNLVIGENGGGVENPIAYYYEQTGISLDNMQPRRLVPLLMAGELALAPLLAAFFGLLWVSADYKNRTFRDRAIRFGKQSAVISRQLSGSLILLLMLMIAVLAAFGFQAYFRHAFYADFPDAVTTFPMSTESVPAVTHLKCIAFVLFIMLLFYELGFAAGSLFRQNPVSYALVGAYVIFSRPVLRYGIANIIGRFAQKIFPFTGATTLTPGKPIALLPGALILIAALLVLIALNSVIVQKRSAY